MKNFTALSLFANVGIAETYLEEAGVKVAVANELLEERVKFYREMHPVTDMICGDITDQKVQEQILASSREHGVNLVIAKKMYLVFWLPWPSMLQPDMKT